MWQNSTLEFADFTGNHILDDNHHLCEFVSKRSKPKIIINGKLLDLIFIL